MAEYWHNLLPFPSPFSLPASLPAPLCLNKPLPSDGQYNDFQDIQWQALLAGGTIIPSLSFAQSEREFLRSQGDSNIQIQRRWDVDSFLARATTLAVHKGGFQLAYQPSFLRRIQQNAHVTFNDHAVHTLKQLRLGAGLLCAGHNYQCHVFFPHMPVGLSGVTHLTHIDQAIWYDQIVIPALRSSCPTDVVQHHPRSYADARGKAHVKQEQHPQSTGQSMDLRYFVPETHLRDLWDEVLRLANSAAHPRFREPFLLVSAHNLKLATKRDTSLRVRTGFIQHLHQCFHWDPELFPPHDCWLDLGMEDTPIANPDRNTAVTLLRKTSCLNAWVNGFRCPNHVRPHTLTERYCWASARDAGSASVELTPRNALRAQGFFALGKNYNLHKDLHTTPLKGYKPFGNAQFEALAYSQEMLEQWYAVNVRGSNASRTTRRQHLMNAYQRTKARLAVALLDSMTTDFGVRQEYRIRWELFEALDLDDIRHMESVLHDEAFSAVPTGQHRAPNDDHASTNHTSHDIAFGAAPTPTSKRRRQPRQRISSSSDSSHKTAVVNADRASSSVISHRPYWVLSTREVNMFVAEELNRWLFCAEVLMLQTQRRPQSLPASNEEQMTNGITLSAVMRTLRTSLDGLQPARYRDLWLDTWFTQARRGPRRKPASDPAPDDPHARWGLNYRDSVRAHGLAWLPNHLIQWDHPPTFTPAACRRLALAKNGLQASFPKTSNIQGRLDRNEQFTQLFTEAVRARHKHRVGSKAYDEKTERAMNIGASLVIQLYIQDIWALLATRVPNADGLPQSRINTHAQLQAFTSALTLEEASGLRGLSYSMVERVLGLPPRLLIARTGRKPGYGAPQFGQYDTGLWSDKLLALFAWNDDVTEDSPTRRRQPNVRAWHNTPFRHLARRLVGIIKEDGVTSSTPDCEELFLHTLQDLATAKLWIIPHYDSGKLSTMQKVSKQNARETREDIATRSLLQRTSWLLPQMPKEHHAALRRAEFSMDMIELCNADTLILFEHDDESEPEPWHEMSNRAHMEIADALMPGNLQLVLSTAKDVNSLGVPKDPAQFAVDMDLPLAADFHERLKRRMEKRAHEAFSKDSEED